MEDKLITCPHCGSNVCYAQKVDGQETAMCLNCGYTTTTLMLEGSETETQHFEKQPQLYRDLRFVDSEKHVWYPAVITLPERGMIYVDGTSIEDWEWVYTPFTRISRRERRLKKLDKNKQFKADSQNTKRFGKDGFIEAAAALGLFGEA